MSFVKLCETLIVLFPAYISSYQELEMLSLRLPVFRQEAVKLLVMLFLYDFPVCIRDIHPIAVSNPLFEIHVDDESESVLCCSLTRIDNTLNLDSRYHCTFKLLVFEIFKTLNLF